MARSLSGPFLICVVNLSLFCISNGYSSGRSGRTHVFVSLTGKDNYPCGSRGMPCRTIGFAVQQGTWGATIYLDGTGTEQQPYSCPGKTSDIPGIHVNKSLSIIGYLSLSHVLCTSGVFFTAPQSGEDMLVKLSGIVFWRTNVFTRNCSIHVTKCTFRDTHWSSAVNMTARNIGHEVFLVIRDTLFVHNSLCISAEFDDQVRELNVRIEIQDTRFYRNGLIESVSRTGGILLSKSFRKVKVSKRSNRLMHVCVRCHNVTYVENKGRFMTVDISRAMTNETYVKMRIVNNSINNICMGGIWKSVYSSRARITNVTFVSIHCENNRNARCIGIASEELFLRINDSLFSGQHLKNENGGALYVTRPVKAVNINLKNTIFERNSAEEGGCAFVDNGNGKVYLEVFNVNFKQCQAHAQGGALIVGSQNKRPDAKRGIRELFANFRNIVVANCTTTSRNWWNYGAICLYVRKGNSIEFNHMMWVGNSAGSCSALFVGSTEKSTQIQINDSLLVENQNPIFGNLCTASLVQGAGSITVMNSRVVRAKHAAMYLDPLFEINIQNVTVTASRVGIFVLIMKSWHSTELSNPTVNITNCLFESNNVCIKCIFTKSSGRVAFTVKDSIFSGPLAPTKTKDEEKDGMYSILLFVESTESDKTIDRTDVSFDNVTVDSLTGTLFNLKRGNVTAKVLRSTFKNCTMLCLHYGSYCNNRMLQYGGAMTFLFRADTLLTTGCTNGKARSNTHTTWKYESRIIVEDTNFDGNEGLKAGAVYLSNGYVSFRRCFFKNNFALQRGGHVSAGIGSGQIELMSSTFWQTNNISRSRRKVAGPHFVQFLYSESSGPLNITNTSMTSNISTANPEPVLAIAQGGYVDINPESHIHCAVGSKLTLENLTHLALTQHNNKQCKLNLTVLRFSCGLCPPGQYSLQRGITSGLSVKDKFRCLPCPYGATCIHNIVAKPNFWGYQVSRGPPSLNFTFCPEEYCSSPEGSNPSWVYNGCHGNREGVLCGRCRKGYTESLFSTECRLAVDCYNVWFWLGTGIALVCLACYLVRKPPLLAFLRRQIFWFRPKSDEYQGIEESNFGHSHHSDSGYLKITFYFYQVADLLLVGSLVDIARQVPFVVPVVGLFKLQIQAFDKGLGCPFPGLTAVTKELFMSTGSFAVMAIVLFIYVLHRALNFIRGQERPHPIRYLAVALETLLLSYERLTETALKLLHCVPLGSDWLLVYDGHQRCWQWWQTVLLLYILVFLLPFIGVLYWGSRLLYLKRISIREFLGASALPLPFLVRWAVLHLVGRLEEQLPEECLGKEVLEVLHGPFRLPSAHDQGSLYWESVLTGRRFILLSLHAFIGDPMMRLACMTGACILMAFHHVIKRPYRDPKANRVETASLLVLSLIGVTNLARASFVSAGVDPGGPTRMSFVAFRWLEVLLLAFVPGSVVLLTSFAVLSQLLRLVIFLASKIILLFRSGTLRMQSGIYIHDSTTPLLAPT